MQKHSFESGESIIGLHNCREDVYLFILRYIHLLLKCCIDKENQEKKISK